MPDLDVTHSRLIVVFSDLVASAVSQRLARIDLPGRRRRATRAAQLRLGDRARPGDASAVD